VSRTILIECSPRRPADGVVVPLRLVMKAVARANFLGVQWHPAVISVPAFESSLGFDGRNFGAAPSPQIGDLVFALTAATRAAASLVWANAAVTIRAAAWPAAGGDAADGDFVTIWRGQAEDIATSDGAARVRLLDNGQALRVPALAAKFGSSGDALLDSADAVKDRSADTRVPRAWGRLLSIPGLLVDRANGIWLFAGNAATSVQAFYDGGADFTPGAARASLAALQANPPAAGAVDYCLDAGGKFLARPWKAPIYPFAAAATFGSARVADIASSVVTGRTAVGFAAGTVAAFNGVMAADHGLYLDDDASVASVLDRLFAGVGGWWRLGSAGTITLGRWGWAAPALTIPAHRRHRPDRLRVLAPTRRRALGYARNDRVHTESEIARILLADDLAYADGTAIEDLKPAEAGATFADNLVANAGLAVDTAQWLLSAGVNRQAGAPGEPAPALLLFQPGFSETAALFNRGQSRPLPATGPLFVRVWSLRGTGTTGRFDLEIYWQLADGSAATPAFTATSIRPTLDGLNTVNNFILTPPAGAVAFSGRIIASDQLVSFYAASGLRIGVTQPAADVTADAVPSLSVPPAATMNFDFTGTAVSGELPRTLRAVRKRGDVDVSGSTTWSLAGGGFTASIAGDGAITITAIAATTIMTVVSTRDGVTLSADVALERRLAPPPSGGGGGGTTATDSTLGSTASTSYGAAIGGPMTVKTGASGRIDLYADLAFIVSTAAPAGAFGVIGKWQWRIVGGSWADAAAEVSETASCVITDEGGGFFVREDGAFVANVAVTGLSASTDYEVQFLARVPSGSRSRAFIGTVTAVGS
jgi:hypothetical protein